MGGKSECAFDVIKLRTLQVTQDSSRLLRQLKQTQAITDGRLHSLLVAVHSNDKFDSVDGTG